MGVRFRLRGLQEGPVKTGNRPVTTPLTDPLNRPGRPVPSRGDTSKGYLDPVGTDDGARRLPLERRDEGAGAVSQSSDKVDAKRAAIIASISSLSFLWRCYPAGRCT